MKKYNSIEILAANKLMRSPTEVTAFEKALAELGENPNHEDLPNLHLILDDRCERPEVMFGLIHFLESFEMSVQLKAFVTVVPELIVSASEWTKIIHNRILNDESAGNLYRDILHSFNSQHPNFIRQLLEESATYSLNNRDLKLELAG